MTDLDALGTARAAGRVEHVGERLGVRRPERPRPGAARHGAEIDRRPRRERVVRLDRTGVEQRRRAGVGQDRVEPGGWMPRIERQHRMAELPRSGRTPRSRPHDRARRQSTLRPAGGAPQAPRQSRRRGRGAPRTCRREPAGSTGSSRERSTVKRIAWAMSGDEDSFTAAQAPSQDERLGMVVSGSMTFRIGEEERKLGPGDASRIPSNTPRSASAGPDGAVALDVFAPTRDDWKALDAQEPRPPLWPSRLLLSQSPRSACSPSCPPSRSRPSPIR